MQLCGGLAIRFVGDLRGVEGANVVLLAVRPYPRNPLARLRVPKDAFESGLVVLGGGSVLLVFTFARYAQVGDAVVQLVLIDVIQVAHRPLAIDIQVCQPMG